MTDKPTSTADIPLVSSRTPPESGSGRATTSEFGRHAGLALLVPGLLFFAGTVVDLGILWIFQRQQGLQWEFVALTSTAEAYPRFALGLSLLAAAGWSAGVRSMAAWRGLAALVAALGLAAAALAGLTIMDYVALIGDVPVDAQRVFKSSILKTTLLFGLSVASMVPVGVMMFRRPART